MAIDEPNTELPDSDKKIYHDLGFDPEEESLERNRFGWKMVGLLTKEEMR